MVSSVFINILLSIDTRAKTFALTMSATPLRCQVNINLSHRALQVTYLLYNQMYFSGWMTDAHYSYWCYSISGLCDILVPPSITCSIWLSSHDNRTGALLLWCRCFLCVCSKSNDQLELCNNCRQHRISSHIHKMHAIKTKLLIMFYLPHVFYPPRP